MRFAHQRKLLCNHIANHAINLVPSESKCLAVRVKETGRQYKRIKNLKKLLTWGAVGLITTALLDPLLYSMLDKPIPWLRDLFMVAGGVACFYVLIKYRDDL